MSNLLGVEENPQEQPAECSWGSGDRSVNGRFLRITNPDTDTRTLLMGEIFFKHLAKHMGYVERSVVEEEQNRFRQELEDARNDLSAVDAKLDGVRDSFNSLGEIQDSIKRMSDLVEAMDRAPGEDMGDNRQEDNDTDDNGVERGVAAEGRDAAVRQDPNRGDKHTSEFGDPGTAEGAEFSGVRVPPGDESDRAMPDEGPNTRKTDPSAPGSGKLPEHAGTDSVQRPEDKPDADKRSSGKSSKQ